MSAANAGQPAPASDFPSNAGATAETGNGSGAADSIRPGKSRLAGDIECEALIPEQPVAQIAKPSKPTHSSIHRPHFMRPSYITPARPQSQSRIGSAVKFRRPIGKGPAAPHFAASGPANRNAYSLQSRIRKRIRIGWRARGATLPVVLHAAGRQTELS